MPSLLALAPVCVCKGVLSRRHIGEIATARYNGHKNTASSQDGIAAFMAFDQSVLAKK